MPPAPLTEFEQLRQPIEQQRHFHKQLHCEQFQLKQLLQLRERLKLQLRQLKQLQLQLQPKLIGPSRSSL